MRKGLSKKLSKGGIIAKIYYTIMLNYINKNVIIDLLAGLLYNSKVNIRWIDHKTKVKQGSI